MPSISDDSPSQGLSEFFHTIWGDTEGFVYLPTLNREDNDWKRVFFKWPEHEKAVVQHVLASTAQGRDSYYSPALYKTYNSATKDNVLGSHVLWAEFDGDAPDNWAAIPAGDSPEAPEAGRQAHSAHSDPIPAPSLRVQSSQDGHEHVYWRLDEFCTDIQWLEDRNRSITYSKRADTSGWDATQILRPPFTTNYKRDLPVTVVNDNGPEYSRQVFQGLKPPPVIVSESIDTEDLPKFEGIIAKYPWDEEHFALFMDPQIPEGSRSSALMRLGYFCAEAGMSDQEAYTILENADRRWGKYLGRNDRKRRLVDIINRARQKHPNGVVNETFSGLLGTKTEQGLSLTYGFSDFLASEVHVEWEIEGLLEKGGFGLMAAMPGVGKTQMSIQLGISCSLGTNFLGWKIPKPRKIVLLSLEMSHVGLKIFLQTIAREYTPEQHAALQDNFIVVPLGEPISFDKPEGMKFLETILDDIEPDGLIIDSIGKLSMEELSEKTAKGINAAFLHLRKRYGCFIWVIHHNRKATDNNKKPAGLADVYGNMYLTAEMTTVLVLWPDPEKGEIEIITAKSRLSEMRKPFRVARNENLYFREVQAKALDEIKHLAKESNGNGHRDTPGGNGLFKL